MPTIAAHTLGCRVNQYDTEAMLELFLKNGYTAVPITEKADVYLINTCTVTGTGDKKSLQLTRRVHRQNPQADIILCGCLAQREGENLLKEAGVTLVIGTQRRAEVIELYKKAKGAKLSAVEPLDGAVYEEMTIERQQGHTRAVLKIQEGCDNHCAYCIIPSVRGGVRSRKSGEIFEEAQRLADAGYQELVLTGIHLSSYGRDFKDGTTLLDAIKAAAKPERIKRVRLGSLEPTLITESFAAELAKISKLCPQYHLALQSGSDSVLARMQRRYNTAQYLRSVELLRAVYPDAALTTDVLTGFPAETEEEFAETCEFVKRIGFMKLHVFPFSSRKGTKAAGMAGALSKEEKERRARILIKIGEELSEKYKAGMVGKTRPVLFERSEGSMMTGYTPEYIEVTAPLCAGAIHEIVDIELTRENQSISGEA
ncbi:MAG: tRNA (N(6)-L-threonylcarbamoyladenosine(37)-C(2))-methylthiotransferase MtaB [Eubacteriales bacterium]|nr:tRNA (N(6)-L-threonylcarbamoyladenosine(37)-C(2))-methylthiotransferase MtaB [Eubacteriales bacterium]MDD4511644.1 tRNA (N(6)-L-threonylcarbamoyladenosine(37)-C(2))-methylthiotransferase MtaB [Eubacteriales bacterium]